jgi:hypothetical protein
VQLHRGGRTDGWTDAECKKAHSQLGLRSHEREREREESDFSPRSSGRTCVYFLRREAVFSPAVCLNYSDPRALYCSARSLQTSENLLCLCDCPL